MPNRALRAIACMGTAGLIVIGIGVAWPAGATILIEGQVTVPGGEETGGDGVLDTAKVKKTVGAKIGAFTACYEKALAKDTTLAGKIGVKFTVGTTGKVTSASAISDTLGSAAVTKCVLDEIMAIAFDKPVGGSVEYVFPIVFKPVEVAAKAGPVPPPPPEAKAVVPVPKLIGGVKAIAKACPNKAEVTNGIDDDCDGQIDENEVGSGPLQITLWWDSPADLDLKVTAPKGDKITYKAKKGKSGGLMDKDSRSSCKGGQTIENVYWAEKPPKGTYKVNVKYYSACKDKTKAPATAFVAVAYGGQVLGPYTLEMKTGEEADMIEFVVE